MFTELQNTNVDLWWNAHLVKSNNYINMFFWNFLKGVVLYLGKYSIWFASVYTHL